MFKYWKTLGPIRRKKQIELWDKEDAKRAAEEAKEQARIEAEVGGTTVCTHAPVPPRCVRVARELLPW